jgi:hypothetical protein
MFSRRPDATLATDIPMMRRFLPYASPRRNDSLFYMMQDIEVEAALEFLEKKNRERPPDRPITLFHLFLRSCSQALYLRPGVNRFVKGGKLWQRNDEMLSFSALKEIKDGSLMLMVKRRFHPTTETLDEMADEIYERLSTSRSGKKTTSDNEMNLLLKLPSFVIRSIMFLIRVADNLGVLPRVMMDGDPLYTSAVIANLGSIDYPAGFHHLWEYGTCSLFGVMGKIEPGENGRRKITVAWTYDERINDGLYSYFTLTGIRERVENPEMLLKTQGEPV